MPLSRRVSMDTETGQAAVAVPASSSVCHKRKSNTVALEPKGSSPHPQQPATSPYPELNESTPPPANLRFIVIPSFHLRLGLPSGFFPSGFPTKTLYTFHYSSMRATCPAHLILLDLICLMILGGGTQTKVWRSQRSQFGN
jgi:hypothetical protein